jgi:hypothetical protein
MNTTNLTRRRFLGATGSAVSAAAMSQLFGEATGAPAKDEGLHHPRSAKRVIYLFQSGAPSQLDLFDHKPHLKDLQGEDLPDSIRKGQRLTGMTSKQERFPVAASQFSFAKYGQGDIEISELLPHTATIADEMSVIRTLHTEAINHDPAITFMQTGAQLAGRPSFGSWVSYGLGSMNRDLPSFVAMVSGSGGQPLYNRLWGSGFLATKYQGVKFRSNGDPVLFLSDPEGMPRSSRESFVQELSELNQLRFDDVKDPEIKARITQYELAYRMQASVPELTDISDEPQHVFDLYGEDAKLPGTFAYNCLLARRLCERDVRFIQLFHRGWDQHANLPEKISIQCRDTDQASAALVKDLRQRGLLDDTLVVWGGEFGRTVYCQGKLTAEDYGRDHHPRCFSIWMAGGGIKPGLTIGTTDDFSYNAAERPIHVHDLNATLLHCLGIEHTKLTFKFQGRHYRLTDVHGEVIRDILKS